MGPLAIAGTLVNRPVLSLAWPDRFFSFDITEEVKIQATFWIKTFLVGNRREEPPKGGHGIETFGLGLANGPTS